MLSRLKRCGKTNNGVNDRFFWCKQISKFVEYKQYTMHQLDTWCTNLVRELEFWCNKIFAAWLPTKIIYIRSTVKGA